MKIVLENQNEEELYTEWVEAMVEREVNNGSLRISEIFGKSRDEAISHILGLSVIIQKTFAVLLVSGVPVVGSII